MLRPSRLVLAIGLLAAVILLPAGQHCVAAQGAHPKAAESTGHVAAVPEGEHAAEDSANPMKAEPTLAIWTLVVFLGLLAVLTKFAWKPLMHALHEREKHLEHVLARDRTGPQRERDALERAPQADGPRRRRGARPAREGAARRTVDRRKHRQGSPDRGRVGQAAGRPATSARARDQALAEIWQKTADMAVSVAGRVLSKELTDDDHRRLLTSAIARAARGPRGQRARRKSLMTDAKGGRAPRASGRRRRFGRGRAPLRRSPRSTRPSTRGPSTQVLDELDELERDVLEAQPAVRPDPGVATGFLGRERPHPGRLARKPRLEPAAAVSAGAQSPRAARIPGPRLHGRHAPSGTDATADSRPGSLGCSPGRGPVASPSRPARPHDRGDADPGCFDRPEFDRRPGGPGRRHPLRRVGEEPARTASPTTDRRKDA